MRVRRSLWSFLSTLLLTAVTMLVGLKSSPLLEAWLGDRSFGARQLMTVLTGYLALLEFGLSGALSPLLARAVTLEEKDDLYKTVVVGCRGFVRVVLSMLFVGLALTPVISWFAPGLTPAEVIDLRYAWLVGLAVFIPIVLNPLRAVIETQQRGYVINLLLTAQCLMMTGLALLLARAKWGLIGQSIALVSSIWTFNLVVALIVFKDHPGLFRACLYEKPDPSIRQAMRGLSVPVLILNIFGRVSYLTDDLVVSRGLGTAQVTSLFFTQRLATLGQSILQSIGSSTWAALADLYAKREIQHFNQRLIELTRLTTILAAGGLAPVIAYNHVFFKLWANPDLTYAGDLVIVAASVSTFLIALQSLWCWCFTATGNVSKIVPLTIANALLNIMISVILVRPLGVVGPLIGTSISLLLVNMWALPLQLHSVFSTSLRSLAGATIPSFLWGGISASGLWWFTRYHQPTTWLGLGLEMSLSAFASLSFSAMVLLSKDERATWRNRLIPTRFR